MKHRGYSIWLSYYRGIIDSKFCDKNIYLYDMLAGLFGCRLKVKEKKYYDTVREINDKINENIKYYDENDDNKSKIKGIALQLNSFVPRKLDIIHPSKFLTIGFDEILLYELFKYFTSYDPDIHSSILNPLSNIYCASGVDDYDGIVMIDDTNIGSVFRCENSEEVTEFLEKIKSMGMPRKSSGASAMDTQYIWDEHFKIEWISDEYKNKMFVFVSNMVYYQAVNIPYPDEYFEKNWEGTKKEAEKYCGKTEQSGGFVKKYIINKNMYKKINAF